MDGGEITKTNHIVCSQCQQGYPADDIIEIEKHAVCFNCKPEFLQKIKEGVVTFKKERRLVWWKVYFFILLFLELISYTLIFEKIIAKKDIMFSVLHLVIYPWVLVAIFGYAFNKKILGRAVWRILFPVTILYDCIGHYLSFTDYESPAQLVGIIIFFTFVVLPVSIFQYIAQYRYSYSKTAPWT